MDVEPDVVLAAQDTLTRVNPHPDPNHVAVGPRKAREDTLGLDRRTYRPGRSRERCKEGVALGLHHDAATSRDRVPQYPVMGGQQVSIRVAEPLEQSRRTLDVREHERHGPRRQLRIWHRPLHRRPATPRCQRSQNDQSLRSAARGSSHTSTHEGRLRHSPQADASAIEPEEKQARKINASTFIDRPVRVSGVGSPSTLPNRCSMGPGLALEQISEGPIGLGTRIRRRNRHFGELIDGECDRRVGARARSWLPDSAGTPTPRAA